MSSLPKSLLMVTNNTNMYSENVNEFKPVHSIYKLQGIDSTTTDEKLLKRH